MTLPSKSSLRMALCMRRGKKNNHQLSVNNIFSMHHASPVKRMALKNSEERERMNNKTCQIQYTHTAITLFSKLKINREQKESSQLGAK
jgi:hypothetical protein